MGKLKLTFEEICAKIYIGEHFTLARVGDGEWRAICGRDGENCDGHKYFPDMGKELANIVIKNPEYYLASHLLSSDVDRSEIEKWQKENNIKVNWACTSGIFHESFVSNKMDLFFKSLKGKKVCLVAPSFIIKNNKKIDAYSHVKVSEKNCWNETDSTMSSLVCIINSENPPDIILFCASMAANVWIDRLYEIAGESITLIDLGSTLDPYCGILSRSFHRKNIHLIK